MRYVRSLLFLGIALALAPDSGAQWLKLPTPGLPRLPDGKPNLTAPAPRTADGKPDFSGLWKNDRGDYYYNNIAVDLQPGDVAPWADALYQKRRLEFGKDSMETLCLPFGPVYLTTRYRMARIVQTPTLIVLLYDDLVHREIFMDGRSLEPDPNPTWMGYSVGRWEGDTLVVESNGYADKSWLDFDGHPHTEDLRITERYTRRDIGHIDVHVTMTDPKAYFKADHVHDADGSSRPTPRCSNSSATTTRAANAWRPPPPRQPVEVPAATLAGYVGVYDVVDADGSKTVAAITLSGTTLWLDYNGKGKEPLIPLSSIRFSWSGTIVEFSRPREVSCFTTPKAARAVRAAEGV